MSCTPGDSGIALSAATSSTRPTSLTAKRCRRSHRKTRNGCDECRRRHIRCGKERPACRNCEISQRICAYPNTLRFKNPGLQASNGQAQLNYAQGNGPQPLLPPINEPRMTSLCEPNRSPIHISSQPLSAQQGKGLDLQLTNEPSSFSVTDLLLFHHAKTEMDHNGIGPQGHMQQVLALAMRQQAKAPYLLDQVLALAAVHLSVHLPATFTTARATPEGATQAAATIPVSTGSSSLRASVLTTHTVESLRLRATYLQTRAVTAFTQAMQCQGQDNGVEGEYDSESVLLRFLFAGLLSLQDLAEAFCELREKELSFQGLIDRCVHCFNLHRGMPVAMGQPMKEFVNTSADVQSMFQMLNIYAMSPSPQGTECDPLSRMLDASELSGPSLDACYAAKNSLQRSFDMYNLLPTQNVPHAASTFAVTVPEVYVELLRKRCSEAFVVLAYYGALVHRCRRYWAFQDAGIHIVLSISQYLGSYWTSELAWPLRVVETERG